MQTINELQQKFRDIASVNIVKRDELIILEVNNMGGNAEFMLLGAQLIRYSSIDSSYPIIWRSKETTYTIGNPVRGGIPIIAPWFGDLDTNPEEVRHHNQDTAKAPAHGFARTRNWILEEIIESGVDQVTQTTISFRLDYEGGTDVWDNALTLKVTYVIGKNLSVKLETINAADKTMTVSLGLHTYFAVSDCSTIMIPSFDECEYYDTLDQWKQKKWQGSITFNQEFDAQFVGVPTLQEIVDSSWDRKIILETVGSASAVVWNPWAQKAKKLSMFGDQEYRDMLCIETANVQNDAKEINAGESHTLGVTISIQKIN